MDYTTYETERLILKPTTEEDADFILALYNTPNWLRFIGDRNVKSTEDAKNYIRKKMLPQLERLGYASFTVINKSDQTRMGTCGLFDREGLDGIDIGFAFLPQFEGKGFGYECGLKLINLAKNEFGIDSIQAITVQENVGSQKLLGKLGLEKTGTTRIPGDPEELLLYHLQL